MGQISPALRAALCRGGSYQGARPVKARNRFLLWDGDEIERLAQGQAIEGEAA
ncbi:MAG: monooxygenase [Pseudomonadota bacterium]|nr:monooxygenase [Pseudomonadota bacterium]